MSRTPRTKLPTRSRDNLAEQAYLAIRNRILHGELTLGSVLSRRKLAIELKMSMLPVCAAIQRLEDEGLLESKPRVGTRVRIPTERDIHEHYIIREALEAQAARLVAESATLQQRQELVRMAEQLDALNRRAKADGDTGFLFALHGYHMQLHLRIAEFTGVFALRRLIEKNNILIFNMFLDLHTAPALRPFSSHSELVKAVTGENIEAADQAMRKHIQYGEENTVRSFGQVNSTTISRWRSRRSRLIRAVGVVDGDSVDVSSSRQFQLR